jgi:hypothetical protein
VGWKIFFPVVLLCQFFCVMGNSLRCYLSTIPIVPLCLVAQVSFLVEREEVLGVTYLPTIPVVPLCQFFGFGRK